MKECVVWVKQNIIQEQCEWQSTKQMDFRVRVRVRVRKEKLQSIALGNGKRNSL